MTREAGENGLAAEPGEVFGTLIVPIYNAASFLSVTLSTVRQWLAEQPLPWELVLVDDASEDATPAILTAFAEATPGERIRIVRFTSNRGKGFAVRVGLQLARGRYAVFTDCDLAYPMSNVASIVARLEAGADAAIACRVDEASTYLIRPGFFSYLFTRHLMGRWFNWICRMVTVPRIRDTQAGLKGFRTEVVKPVLARLRLDGFSFDVELLRSLIDCGARIDEVPVSFRYDSEPTTVRFTLDSIRMARDLVLVRLRSRRGHYRVPTRPRRLVIHADDYGLSPGVNRAIEEALESGAVTSCSIMLGEAAAHSAIAWAAGHPQFDFGVHLNLTQGRPVLPPSQVPSLVDSHGHFWRLGTFILRCSTGRVRLREVELEWRAQIGLLRAAGVVISHLDSHQHVHLLPWVFRNVAARLAAEEGLVIRAMRRPIVVGRLRPDARSLALAVASLLSVGRRHRSLVAADASGVATQKRDRLDDLKAFLVQTANRETCELTVHPGIVDDDLIRSGDGYRAQREEERALLAAAETQAWFRLNDFELTSFRTLSRTR